jgi:hypothetical protein
MDGSSIRRVAALRLAEGGGAVTVILELLARFVPSLGGWARGAWCRQQRHRLVGVTTRVLWVSPDKVPWAVWGAEHRFFDADWAGSLLYLRAR